MSAPNPAPKWYRRPHVGRAGVLAALMAFAAAGLIGTGIASADDGQHQEEDVGSQAFPTGYPLPSAVDRWLTQHFVQEGYEVEYPNCQYFAPALGPPPVYDCSFKLSGVWHDDIQATGHPDGSFRWQDYTSGVRPVR